jgi:hypothetical protein
MMNRRPAVQIPELSGIDLDFRPRDYFWAADLKIRLLSGIGGETRRQLVGELVTGGHSIPAGLDAPVLDEKARQAWGRMHPSNMGGEFLPALRQDEVEIARISLASVTADQISVRARRSGKRIAYCVVDEYGSEIATYSCRPASSVSPLSLRRLIALMESACEGGSIIHPILKMNPEAIALEKFVTVTSDFYPDLGRYYRALTDAWVGDLRALHPCGRSGRVQSNADWVAAPHDVSGNADLYALYVALSRIVAGEPDEWEDPK